MSELFSKDKTLAWMTVGLLVSGIITRKNELFIASGLFAIANELSAHK